MPCVFMLKLVRSVRIRILVKNSNSLCIASALAAEGGFFHFALTAFASWYDSCLNEWLS